jgi:hypothetical protein
MKLKSNLSLGLDEVNSSLLNLLEHLFVFLVFELLPVGLLPICLPVISFCVNTQQSASYNAAGSEPCENLIWLLMRATIQFVL